MGIHQALWVAPAAGGGADPLWADVLLLLNGDGASITDHSSYARALTLVNMQGVTEAEAFSRAFTTSGGGPPVYTSWSRSGAEWDSDEWTWETRFKRQADGLYTGLFWVDENLHIILDGPNNTNTYGVLVVLNQVPFLLSSATCAIGDVVSLAVSVAFSAGTYTFRVFVDGVLSGTNTSTDTNSALSSGVPLGYVGRHDQAFFSGLTGWLEEYRVTAACRYTGSYTPASSAFPQTGP